MNTSISFDSSPLVFFWLLLPLGVIMVAFVAYQFSLLLETSWKYRHESARPLITVIVMTIVGLAILAFKAARCA